MRRIAIYILPLILLTGCATTQGPEPTLSQTTQPQAKQKSVQAVKQPAESRQVYVPRTPQQAEEVSITGKPEQQVVARAVEPARKDLSVPPGPIGEPPTESKGWAKLAESNDNKLMNVYKGMDKATVEIIMASAHNPYKHEKITGKNDQLFEVLFYLTREPRKGKPITEKLLTPVIFKNSEVVAMGSFQLKKLRTKGTVGREKKSSAKPK
jgi:hypothetical protein